MAASAPCPLLPHIAVKASRDGSSMLTWPLEGDAYLILL
jgi:hypothetical protein